MDANNSHSPSGSRRKFPLARASSQPPDALKPFEPEDPMELTGVLLPGGDLEEQLEAIILEYLMLGWSARQILLLFRKPVFAGTYHVWQLLGEERVKARIDGMYREWSRGWLRGGEHHA